LCADDFEERKRGLRASNLPGLPAAHFSVAELDRLFDPESYLGTAEQLVERALAARTSRK